MERDMHYLDEHSEGHNKCSSGSHLPQRIILGRCDNGKEKLERYYKKVAENKDIIPENKKLILEFYELCRAKGLSNARLCKTIWIMKNIGIWMGKKSFAEATKADIVQLVNLIQDRYSEPATATDYKTMLKKFYKCTFGKEKTMPEAVEWVKVKNGRDEGKIDPSQIFTEDDILRILQAEDIPNNTWAKIRNKALVSFIYDSGVRIGELLSMRTGDIKISNELWYVTVIGKTGQRTFPIFPFIPYLKDYLSIHPR